MTTRRKPSPFKLRLKKDGATLIKVGIKWDSRLKQAAQEIAEQQTKKYGTTIGIMTVVTNCLMYDPDSDPEIREVHVQLRQRYRELIKQEPINHVQKAEEGEPSTTEF